MPTFTFKTADSSVVNSFTQTFLSFTQTVVHAVVEWEVCFITTTPMKTHQLCQLLAVQYTRKSFLFETYFQSAQVDLFATFLTSYWQTKRSGKRNWYYEFTSTNGIAIYFIPTYFHQERCLKNNILPFVWKMFSDMFTTFIVPSFKKTNLLIMLVA